MDYNFVKVNEFTPNAGGWTTIGNISGYVQSDNVFLLTLQGDPSLKIQLSFLSAFTFRVRFNPSPNYNYTQEISAAVVSRNLGNVNLNVQKINNELHIDTGEIQLVVALQPYLVKVYRNGQLINQDYDGDNLVYIPGQQVVANFKVYPANAKYCGFGEKAGPTLLKNNSTMSFFNYDNFSYGSSPVPTTNPSVPGPLNPRQSLYLSVPLLIEVNPAPQDDYQGAPYAYGIFFDNPAQSYFNLGSSDYSNMYGKYYFGALYGDMDYYFMFGADTTGVLYQYTSLTGRSAMPPKYIFGFHQGAYGYYSSSVLSVVANSYRSAKIPIDGLHIDVDFQDNYRTFTSSNIKFPNVAQYMSYLHSIGFKCSTNITPMLRNDGLDENGEQTPYTQRDALLAINGLIYNTMAGEGPNPELYSGTVSYGNNSGKNPYMPVGAPLGTQGSYPDLGRTDVSEKWGEQYAYLINQVGMDMVWQDMTDPAIANAPPSTFPLALEVNNGIGYVPHAVCHNQYALNLVAATYAGLQKLKPEKRPFIITRGGYAGMQRYAALWTGDSASSWNFLKIYIPEILNISLSGIPISGSDIGGFAMGVLSDPTSGTTSASQYVNGQIIGAITNYELFTRWMQIGAFLPWYRNHYNGYQKQFQEVYAYGEPVPTNCRKYIELRYRMLQIFYDAMYQWTQTGTPIVKPLFVTDGTDINVFDHLDDQFILGSDLLIAPITGQHETANPPTTPLRNVYLPSGSNWYAYMDNSYPLQPPVTGGTLVTNYYAGLDLVPIYVREGAILPMRELEQYVGQLPQNPLTINIYPGPDRSYQLYLDDGISTEAALSQKYRIVTISHATQNNVRTVNLIRSTDNFTPAEPYYFVALLGTAAPSSVNANGNGLPNVFDPDSLAASPVNCYYWNSGIQITFIKVYDSAANTAVQAIF